MKIVFSVMFLLVLLSAQALAEPISFSINDQTDGEITLLPGDDVVIGVSVEPNNYVYGINIDTENELLAEIIDRQMSAIERHERSEELFTKDFGFVAPDALPAGEHEVFVTIDYSDNNYADQTIKQTILLTIPKEGKNGMVGFLTGLLGPDSAAEVVDKMIDTTIEPLPKEPTQEELLRHSNKYNLNYDRVTFTKVSEISKDVSSDWELSLETNLELKETVSELRKIKQPTVTKDMEVYEVKDDTTVTHLSKIIISISYPGDSLNNVVIVENIPKEVAAHVNDLTFSHKAIVIQEDPIVKWQFDHIPEEQTQQVSYTVDKELQEIPGDTYAGGSESGFFAKLIAQIIESLIGSSQE